MKMISTPDAPSPAGHYSQAVVYGDTVYVSGQLAVNPVTGEKGIGSIEEQTRLTLRNIEQILLSAGSDLDHVVKTTAYVSDVELWGGVNQAYAEVFGDHRPARVVVPSRDLHYGCLVEIDAIAALR
jgi:2-iminobutanoate/2-iminopropanoate deaminase